MPTLFQNKVALVTGGGGSIGSAAALAYAREGARVVIADVEGGETTVEKIRSAGGEALYIKTDISKADQVEALIHAITERFGRLDLALNNAGIRGKWARSAEISEEGWDRIIQINLKGVWLSMKYEILAMLKSGGGTIVNMASVLGLSGFGKLSAYSASKHGIVALTKTAALEYAEKGIRINAVCPGYVDTNLLQGNIKNTGGFKGWVKKVKKEMLYALVKKLEPAGRFGKPDEVASVVIWLSSQTSSPITGQALVIDGGHLAGRNI